MLAPSGDDSFGDVAESVSRGRTARNRETDRPGSASSFSLEGDGRKPRDGPASGTGSRDKRGVPEDLVGVDDAAVTWSILRSAVAPTICHRSAWQGCKDAQNRNSTFY
jgi:hypothetical protein